MTTAVEIAAGVRAGSLDPRDVVAAALQRLDAIDATGAISERSDQALERASSVPRGPLAGVPIVLKDNILQAGQPCTCGSRLLEGYVAPYDAHVVEALEAAGAVVVGRAHMDEFGMGSTTEHCAWGPVRNPWDLERVPGGSSGGSAAAVASGAVPVALGSDTGGSIRQPAALTGVVGVKPTWGRVSRRGLVAFASSTDQISPLCTTVRDAALVTQVIAGHDPRDATSLTSPIPNWLAACDAGLGQRRIGIPRQATELEGLDPAVRAAFEDGVAALRAAGAVIVDVDLSSLDLAVSCYYIIAPAEASANLARFEGVRYGARRPGGSVDEVIRHTRTAGFGPEVKRRILTGTWVLSSGYIDAYYHRAQQVRAFLTAEWRAVLTDVDAVVLPTTPTPAFRLGEVSDPVQMYLGDVFTIPASLAGLPAVSVPCGTAQGLPVGLQVVGAHNDEATCFQVAAAVEAALPAGRPPLYVA